MLYIFMFFYSTFLSSQYKDFDYYSGNCEKYKDSIKLNEYRRTEGYSLSSEVVTIQFFKYGKHKTIKRKVPIYKYSPEYKTKGRETLCKCWRDGKYVELYENNVIKTIGQYRNGKKIKEWTYFSENGMMQKRYNYSTRKMRFYDENGNLFSKGKRFDNGDGDILLDYGRWKFYHPNGQIQCKGRFKWYGKKGIWKKYDENGNLIDKKRFRSDGFFFRDITDDCEFCCNPDHEDL